MGLFSAKQKTSLGVDIGVGGLKLVELKAERGRAVLSTYGFTEGGWGEGLGGSVGNLVGTFRTTGGQGLPDSILKEIGSVIKQVYLKANAKGKSVVAGVPMSAVFSAVVTVEYKDPKFFNEAAKNEAIKLLPLPAEEMVLDFQEIGNSKESEPGSKTKSGKALVIATSKILVEEYTKIFKYAGLELAVLETESFALLRALLGRDKSPAFLVDIGHEKTNMFVIDKGVPIIHRSIHLGGGNFNLILQKIFGFQEIGLVEQAKIDLSKGMQTMDMPDIFVKAVEPLMQELKYNLELFKKENGSSGAAGRAVSPERIVLSGGSAMIPGLARYLETQFNITTYVADPWARVVYPQPLKPILDAIGPRFAVAIGLAIRNIY